jgi:Protein of unknown function (DUF2934)
MRGFSRSPAAQIYSRLSAGRSIDDPRRWPGACDTERFVEDSEMATRPRSGTSRTAKSPLPSTGAPAGTDASAADVTATTLERREIPSFSESREARIAEAAYWRAEQRGFAAGHELDDWLAAERQIDAENAHRGAALQSEK